MKRKYHSRGVREVEQVENLVAVKPKERIMRREDFSRAFGEVALPHEILLPTWVPFANAGWIFVRPNTKLVEALERGEAPDGLLSTQRIFVGRGTRLYLGANRLSVRLKPAIHEPERALEELGLRILYEAGFARNLFVVQVGPGRDFLEASVNLSNMTDVFEFAEPEFIEHIRPRFQPQDPDFDQQWHLSNTGQDGGISGADIQAVPAWTANRGANIRIAIIDNGIDVNHPDFTGAVSSKSGYFVSDGSHGANFVQGKAGFPAGDGHGTFCAGLTVARSNYRGGVGVANQATLIAIACLQDQVGSQMTLARAIAYAANPSLEGVAGNGADVICCSLGSNDSQGYWDMASALRLAIDGAVSDGRGTKGTPVFWATSDDLVPIANDDVCSYVNTIAVGMSNRWDELGGSAFGPELDFLAPGIEVYSTINGGGYMQGSGTSYAAPVAAGVAALMLAACNQLTAQQVRDFLHDTCDPIGSGVSYPGGRNDYYGFGRINADKAVQRALAECLGPS